MWLGEVYNIYNISTVRYLSLFYYVSNVKNGLQQLTVLGY